MNPLTVNEGAYARHAERIRTLDSTVGLLDEAEFRNASGLTQITRYRRRGLIKPVGFARTNTGMSAFYHPRQITELMRELGVTLKSTEGLLSERKFGAASGLSQITKYRERGLIKPVGFAMAGPSIRAFYHERQIAEFKKQLGITLESTQGLLSEDQFKAASGLTKIPKYRQRGLIKPVGRGMSATHLSHFYHPRQIAELKQKLGVTLKSTEGLLSEPKFRAASGLCQITKYRERGLIKPVGFAMAGPSISAFYHERQIAELRKQLGITLERTQGLLNEDQFIAASGLTNIPKYRQRGLIKPVGRGMSATNLSHFYHPRQIAELKQKLGITLQSTAGLLKENVLRRSMPGLDSITSYRKRGLIKPVGFALAGPGGLCTYYHPRQVAELYSRLGITLQSTKGLLNENQFRKASGISRIPDYRKAGLIKPVGFAMAHSHVGAFYNPRQIAELQKKLGITLKSTRGLLNEGEVRMMSGMTNITGYRQRGLIKPVGFSNTHGGISALYHPRQIAKLKKQVASLKPQKAASVKR